MQRMRGVVHVLPVEQPAVEIVVYALTSEIVVLTSIILKELTLLVLPQLLVLLDIKPLLPRVAIFLL